MWLPESSGSRRAINDIELSKIDKRTDGDVEVIDVKLNNRKTKKLGAKKEEKSNKHGGASSSSSKKSHHHG